MSKLNKTLILTLTAVRGDGALQDLQELLHDIGLGCRRSLNGDLPDTLIVEEMKDACARLGLTNDELVAILKCLREAHGEISKCREVIWSRGQSFSRNTTKEPL